ncbi:hypothetical protein [Lactiplantibacillus plajomi]|nr:hypothetical protein [Lactiplantibacillus plajomi]
MNKDEFDMAAVNRFFEHDYHDRGIVKWQGFFLSDHTSALNKVRARERTVIQGRPVQPLSARTVILADAFAQGYRVKIQLATLDRNGHFYPDLIGTVSGYNATNIVLNGSTFVSLDQIRNVQRAQ